jgi:hypothetical protein
MQIKAMALAEVAQWLVSNRASCVSVGKGALRKCCAYMTQQGPS